MDVVKLPKKVRMVCYEIMDGKEGALDTLESFADKYPHQVAAVKAEVAYFNLDYEKALALDLTILPWLEEWYYSIKKFAGRIYNEAQRLITLVEDTIKVSQLDEGENPYEWEKLDAYTIVKDVCGRLREVAEKKNVHLYIDGGKTMLATVHPILDEVIYNLCDSQSPQNTKTVFWNDG